MAVDDYILNVTVSSSGGDVLEAIKLRKAASPGSMQPCGTRRDPATVLACLFLSEDGAGLSSPYRCESVFIGPSRSLYFAGLTVDQAEEKYKELTTLVRDYLSARHVPQATTDRMSIQLRLLSRISAGKTWRAVPSDMAIRLSMNG